MHVLPGDSLVQSFRQTGIEGTFVVCRECLVDRAVKASSLEAFWKIRESHLSALYPKPAGFYERKVKSQFAALRALPPGSELNLWFEHELFCQVNLWFCLFLLRRSDAEIFCVSPQVPAGTSPWLGFGAHGPQELSNCFRNRERFTDDDVRLGEALWQAYQTNNYTQLARLSAHGSKRFAYLPEVCQAAIEQDSRPARSLRRVVAAGAKDFASAFQAFSNIEGVYGYADLQVRRLYDELH